MRMRILNLLIALFVVVLQPTISGGSEEVAAPGLIGRSVLAAQAKYSLQLIQVALERYFADKGCYPQYLLGGDKGYYFELDYQGKLRPGEGVIDPLLAEGYLVEYPVNVYATAALMNAQVYPNPVSLWQESNQDPYRALGEVESVNYRFGKHSLLMGNVLADPRYPVASTGYPCWNVEGLPWETRANLAGNFLYKSFTPEGAVHPTGYILGVYGPPGWLGLDVLGNAASSLARYASSPGGEGCPYGVDANGEYCFGNPDGRPDGLLMMLTGGRLK